MVRNPSACKSCCALLLTRAPVFFIRNRKAVQMEVFTTQHMRHLK